MKKVYYLATCETCTRILKQLNLPESFEQREIKSNPLSEDELEHLYTLAGSYEALFNKRARLYRERGLSKEDITEPRYRELLMDHYTFLKRPVLVVDDQIFTGNSKKTVSAAQQAITS